MIIATKVSGLKDLSLSVPLAPLLNPTSASCLPASYSPTMVGLKSEPSTSKAPADTDSKATKPTAAAAAASTSLKSPFEEDDEYDLYNLSQEVTQAMIDACEQVEKDYNAYQAAKRQVPVSRARLSKVIEAFDKLWDKEQGSSLPSTSQNPTRSSQAASPTMPSPSSSVQARTPTAPLSPAQARSPTAPTSPVQARTTAPSTPTKTPLRGSQPPPETPINEYQPFTTGTPGTTVRLADFRPRGSSPTVPKRCYVVYVGVGGANGVYETLDEAYAVSGGKANKQALIKRFNDAALGLQCYDDCVRYDLFKLLAVPWEAGEHFVVLAGVAPGVYNGRGQLMKLGLRWRGGEVIRVLGTEAEAQAYFEHHEHAGHTSVLPSFIP
ncbi:hypothetical protein VNI00_003860 [Paramarasmius palmivorus]|uniref:Uncharacterized protein n=1 Tax=Paramarasmius palmivorus TaxID=297713 RepID=A0AAW0DPB4_9AGAR